MNAFQHGLRSASVLLPGEDAQEFETMRNDKLRMYRPCTREELRCVNRIAACQWRADRYTRFGKVFDAKLDALLADDTGTVAQHCDPDPHRWQHRAIDCTHQEGRFDRMMLRAERRLLELQRLRKHGLLAPGDQAMEWGDARKFELAAAAAEAPARAGAAETPSSKPHACSHGPETAVTASPGRGIGEYNEGENAPALVSGIPPQRPQYGVPAVLQRELPPRAAAAGPPRQGTRAAPSVPQGV